MVIALAVNGYYRCGADLAIAACLNGPDDRTLAFSVETAAIQQDRFDREMARIRREGLGRAGEIVWTDVEDRLYPLGLKAIGLLCEAIIRKGMADGDRYVVGFQRFPRRKSLPWSIFRQGDEGFLPRDARVEAVD